MIQLRDVSYVRLGTRDLEGATRYATAILGLEVAERGHGAAYFKSDQREHTLCYFEGDPADQVVAFEVDTRAELDAAGAELERLGHPVHRGTAGEAQQRKVRDFIAFRDPTGNRIELVWRPQMSSRRYHGARDAGITGFSHIGLCTTDAVRDEAFWTSVCNARVSDRIGDHQRVGMRPSGLVEGDATIAVRLPVDDRMQLPEPHDRGPRRRVAVRRGITHRRRHLRQFIRPGPSQGVGKRHLALSRPACLPIVPALIRCDPVIHSSNPLFFLWLNNF